MLHNCSSFVRDSGDFLLHKQSLILPIILLSISLTPVPLRFGVVFGCIITLRLNAPDTRLHNLGTVCDNLFATSFTFDTTHALIGCDVESISLISYALSC